jgi:hypothetical protein
MNAAPAAPTTPDLAPRRSFFARAIDAAAKFVEVSATTFTLIVLAVAALTCLANQIASITHLYPLDYGEAPLIDQAMRLVRGQNIYRADISTPPFTLSNYPPLYIVALAPFVWLFGPTFTAGRAISAICAWVVVVCIALIVRRHTQSKFAAVAAGLTFAAIPYVARWSSFARIDLLALAFSMIALVVLTNTSITQKRLVVGGLLLVASIYTRQSYALAAPLAAFVWLFVNVNRRKAITLALIVGVTCGLLFLLLNIATSGGFYFNIVTANINEWSAERMWWNFGNLYVAAPVLIAMSLFSLLLFWKRKNVWSLTTPYLIGALISALTIGKIGSNVNYFLELCAAFGFAVGAVISWVRTWSRSRFVSIASLALLSFQAIGLAKVTLEAEAPIVRERKSQDDDLIWLHNIVLQSDGEVLADEYMGMLTLSNKPLILQPFEVTQLANAKVWDQTSLVNDINAKKFSHILIHDPGGYPIFKERWTPEMLDAVRAAYRIKQKLANTWVYVPAEKLDTPTLKPTPLKCEDAKWLLPSDAQLGVRWNDLGALHFFGRGTVGKMEVRAVADGLLTRRSDWNDRVAIQHDDPLNPGKKIWTVYANMASGTGKDSFVFSDFALGVENVPVKAGQIIGYQGSYSGQGLPMWMNVLFSVVPSDDFGGLPDNYEQLSVNLNPYLGVGIRPFHETLDTQFVKCGK